MGRNNKDAQRRRIIPITSARKKKRVAVDAGAAKSRDGHEVRLTRPLGEGFRARYAEFKRKRWKEELDAAKSKIIVSDAMKVAARRAFEAGKIIRTHDRFIVFALPEDNAIADDLVLLLWREGADFPELPTATIFYPVTIDGREGYLWRSDFAEEYRP